MAIPSTKIHETCGLALPGMDVSSSKLESDADGHQAVAVAVMETERLVLRPLIAADAPAVAALAGRREIADTTISIPHPYSEARAVEWIATHTVRSGGKEVVFAITLKPGGTLIGAMGLRDIDTEHFLAEMGFWLGLDWWGQGYATEAGRAVLRFAFEQLNLNRVHAHHMVRNPASGRVLEKIGMRQEGLLRQRVKKWGVFEDVLLMSILREDWMRKEVKAPSSLARCRRTPRRRGLSRAQKRII